MGERIDIREIPRQCSLCDKPPTHIIEMKRRKPFGPWNTYNRIVCKEHIAQAEVEGLRFTDR